ncbi:MAG: hypothetical protein ACYC1M_18950 [Armatimonadota bacterium]
MKYHKNVVTTLSLLAVISSTAMASQIVKAVPGVSIIVGAQAQDQVEDSRTLPVPSKLLDVVKQFNTKAKSDPVGKTQPPLTVNELIAALNSVIITPDPKQDMKQLYATIRKIITNKALSDGAYLQSMNRYRRLGPYQESKVGGSDLFEFTVWSVRLVLPHSIGVSSFSIRERFVSYRIMEMEAQGKPTLKATAYDAMHPIGSGTSDFANRLGMMTRDYNGNTIIVGTQAKDQVEESRTLPVPSKLPDVVKQFNVKALNDPVGKTQPALTEKELRAAIQWAMLNRSAQEKSSNPYYTLQTILKTGALVDGAYLKSVNRYDYRVSTFSIRGGTERRVFSVWSVFLVIPYDGGEQSYPIREQFISYHVLRTF